jgi:hypothetical protein
MVLLLEIPSGLNRTITFIQLCCYGCCFGIHDSFTWFVILSVTFVLARFSPRAVASGLLYVSELIEEHSRLAKIIGQRGTYVREFIF